MQSILYKATAQHNALMLMTEVYIIGYIIYAKWKLKLRKFYLNLMIIGYKE